MDAATKTFHAWNPMPLGDAPSFAQNTLAQTSSALSRSTTRWSQMPANALHKGLEAPQRDTTFTCSIATGTHMLKQLPNGTGETQTTFPMNSKHSKVGVKYLFPAPFGNSGVGRHLPSCSPWTHGPLRAIGHRSMASRSHSRANPMARSTFFTPHWKRVLVLGRPRSISHQPSRRTDSAREPLLPFP